MHYQNKCNDFDEAYGERSEETKERFKNETIELLNEVQKQFKESNKKYVEQINQLTGALYTKVASVKQHSMVMNLYEDYCNGLFYFSLTECDSDMEAHPSMSSDFGTILEKLNDIAWDEITQTHTFIVNKIVRVTYFAKCME